MKEGYITQSTLDSIVEKLDKRIEELEAKLLDAHHRESTLIRQLKNREEEWQTLLAYSRKQARDLKDEQESKAGVEKILSEALEQGRKMQEERDNLKAQLEK